MLNLYLFNKLEKLSTLSFLPDQNIADKNHLYSIVTPDPATADLVREELFEKFPELSANVVTISKFMSEQLEIYCSEEEVQRYDKAKLIFALGILWKKMRGSVDFEQFYKAFTILTELRSSTLDSDLANSILQEFDDELGQTIIQFWAFMDSANMVDEHMAYHLLTNSIRLDHPEIDEYSEGQKVIIFWGFKFLTGVQVDFLKSLGIKRNVFVLYPKDVYEKANELDWLNWLTKDPIYSRENVNLRDDLELYSFNKNGLGNCLKQLSKDMVQEKNIFLGTNEFSLELLDEIPLTKVGYKLPVDIFSGPINKAFTAIEEFLVKEPDNVRPTTDLILFVKLQIKEIVTVSEPEYRMIKVYAIILTVLNEMLELSEVYQSFGLFDLRMLNEIVSLRSPRISALSYQQNREGNVYGISFIRGLFQKSANWIVATSEYADLRPGRQKYIGQIQDKLSVIGPIKRPELEFEYDLFFISSGLQIENSKLILEEGLLESSVGWNTIVSGFKNVIKNRVTSEEDSKKIKDPISQLPLVMAQHSHFSQSKLQCYLDCPRKFNLKYNYKFSSKLSFTKEIQPSELGVIEHEVIGEYLKENKELNGSRLIQLIEKKCKERSSLNALGITFFEELTQGIFKNAVNGVATVLKINEMFNIEKMYFEKEIRDKKETAKFGGSIDFVGEGKENAVIIDFKRTASVIPTFTQFQELKKIQLWFYLIRCGVDLNKVKLLGYLSLSKPEDSKFIVFDNTSKSLLKDLPFKTQVKNFEFSIEHETEKYIQYETELIEKIRNIENFPPEPMNISVCHYCDVRNVCPRKELQ